MSSSTKSVSDVPSAPASSNVDDVIRYQNIVLNHQVEKINMLIDTLNSQNTTINILQQELVNLRFELGKLRDEHSITRRASQNIYGRFIDFSTQHSIISQNTQARLDNIESLTTSAYYATTYAPNPNNEIN